MPPAVLAAFGDTAGEALLRDAHLMPDFTFAGRHFLAKIVEFYDGDTVRAVFAPSEWRPELIQYKLRMTGYDSPEMRPLLTSPDRINEKKAAVIARDALVSKIGAEPVVMACGEFDMHGRILATLYTRDGENISDWMIANGHGRPFVGGKRAPWVASVQ
jgi:endonuclease YncB( thermonuclease family)